jgi:hypothetical protein
MLAPEAYRTLAPAADHFPPRVVTKIRFLREISAEKLNMRNQNIFLLLFYMHHADEQSWAQHTFFTKRTTISPESLMFLIGKVLHFHKITRKK